jgi:DNA polymerase I-like protein with 3'-5' exonuclease and polymerase domains
MADIIGTTRQIAKSANFGLLYKSSSFGLYEYCKREGIENITRSQAEEVYTKWHEAMPAFKRWYEKVEAELREKGYVESATGRRRHFGDPALLPRYGPRFAEMLREAINFKVQSLAADLALIALALCHEASEPILGFVHDSILFEFEKGLAKPDLETRLRKTMVDDALAYLKEHFGVDITIPLEVDFNYTEGESKNPKFYYDTSLPPISFRDWIARLNDPVYQFAAVPEADAEDPR